MITNNNHYYGYLLVEERVIAHKMNLLFSLIF